MRAAHYYFKSMSKNSYQAQFIKNENEGVSINENRIPLYKSISINLVISLFSNHPLSLYSQRYL